MTPSTPPAPGPDDFKIGQSVLVDGKPATVWGLGCRSDCVIVQWPNRFVEHVPKAMTVAVSPSPASDPLTPGERQAVERVRTAFNPLDSKFITVRSADRDALLSLIDRLERRLATAEGELTDERRYHSDHDARDSSQRELIQSLQKERDAARRDGEAATLAERERCAKIPVAFIGSVSPFGFEYDKGYTAACEHIIGCIKDADHDKPKSAVRT